MKLNATILSHQLQRYFQMDHLAFSDRNFVKTPVFYTIFFDMNEHIVLVHASDLKECISRVEHSVVICLDRPDTIPDPGTNDLLVIDDPFSDTLAYNIVTKILDVFNEWEFSMNHILYDSQSFQEMLKQLSDILDAPAFLIDKKFRYIAGDAKESAALTTTGDPIPSELAFSMLADERFREPEKHQEAFYLAAPTPAVCRNIFHNGIYAGFLFSPVSQNEDEIEYSKTILNLSATYIETLYSMYSSFENISSVHHQIRQYLSQILNHDFPDQLVFSRLMDSIGFLPEDHFRLLTLIPDDEHETLYGASYLCSQIEHMFPGHYCVSMNGRIAILSNIDACSRAGAVSSADLFRDTLKNIGMVAGQSSSFSGYQSFDTILMAGTQSLYAAEHRSGQDRIAYFSDFALDYLLTYGSDGLSSELFCHPAILILRDHDRLHGTPYSETLETYIHCRYNAVAAAKKLFIHRSTFINRMTRIEELTRVDLEDPEELLYLSISYHQFPKE